MSKLTSHFDHSSPSHWGYRTLHIIRRFNQILMNLSVTSKYINILLGEMIYQCLLHHLQLHLKLPCKTFPVRCVLSSCMGLYTTWKYTKYATISQSHATLNRIYLHFTPFRISY